MEKETRVMQMRLKIEERDDDKPGQIAGYAAVFNKDSADMGFIERIAPGAFANALKRSNVVALKNHDSNLAFGRQGVNLRLKEDDTGLHMEVDAIDTPTYRSVEADVKAGILKHQSFGFTVKADEWRDVDTDTPKRTITEINELFDVSVVVNPAYPDTDVALRCLEKMKNAVERDSEYTGGRAWLEAEDEKRERFMKTMKRI